MRPKKTSKRISLGKDLERPKWKVSILGGFVLILFAMVAAKALDLQVLDRDRAFQLARKQHQGSSTLLPRRGKILDRNMKELAVNVEIKSVFANPYAVKNPAEVSKTLSSKLDMAEKTTMSRLSSKASFVWLKRLVDPEVTTELESMKLEGVGFIEEPKRVYPNGHLMGQVLGFTNIDSTGIEGIEYRYDDLLIGRPGKITLKKDAYGRKIINNPDIVEDFGDENISGHEIVLTIDAQIQHIVERELKEGIEQMNGEKGMAIVLNPETGEVLAMASYPFLDPNDYRKYPLENRRNLPIWYTYEPGSTMKPFAIALALESGKWTPGTLVNTAPGFLRVGRHLVRDVHNYGLIDVTRVISKSSNVGTSKIALSMPAERLWQLYKNIGFGSPTGVGLIGEQPGVLHHFSRWGGEIGHANHSFGYGLSVNMLQLAQAYAVLAADGIRRPLTILKREKPLDPAAERRVLSARAVRQVRSMLEQAVTRAGTGAKAAVPGYQVAGKTGTVHKIVNGRYASNRYFSLFAGMVPASNPRLVMVIIIDEPKSGAYYGGTVAAPVFGKTMGGVLRILNITPDDLPTMKIAGTAPAAEGTP